MEEAHSRWREKLIPKQEVVNELSMFGNSEWEGRYGKRITCVGKSEWHSGWKTRLEPDREGIYMSAC